MSGTPKRHRRRNHDRDIPAAADTSARSHPDSTFQAYPPSDLCESESLFIGSTAGTPLPSSAPSPISHPVRAEMSRLSNPCRSGLLHHGARYLEAADCTCGSYHLFGQPSWCVTLRPGTGKRDAGARGLHGFSRFGRCSVPGHSRRIRAWASFGRCRPCRFLPASGMSCDGLPPKRHVPAYPPPFPLHIRDPQKFRLTCSAVMPNSAPPEPKRIGYPKG